MAGIENTGTKNERRQAFAALTLSLKEFDARGFTPETSDKPSASSFDRSRRWLRLSTGSKASKSHPFLYKFISTA
jgi:hypothetical protein